MRENRCVCCGSEIPEGRQVCWECEHVDTYSEALKTEEGNNEQD